MDTQHMDQIVVDDLTKSFDTKDGKLMVLDDIHFTVDEGSFTTIMGPSGCGKSTLLNILAGLETMDSGVIQRNGNRIDPGEFFYGYVFQEPRLLNWLSVEDNIAFALKAQNIPEQEHQEKVGKYLELVGLKGEEKSYPLRLSGGMRQRVGLARALAVDPDIIFMDEPFSSLDEMTARELREDLIDIWQKTDKTILFVTHNIGEAVYLSDKIIMLDNTGEIFHTETIDIERPREIDDTDLLELESKITKLFLADSKRV